MSNRMGKVEKCSNISLIKVVDFFIIFDKKLVLKKYFFHGYDFFQLQDSQLAGQCWGVLGPASWVPSRLKKTYPEKKYSFQTNFLPNIMKKSTTFISDMLLNFSTIPTLVSTYKGSKSLESYFEINWHSFQYMYAVQFSDQKGILELQMAS